MKTFRQFFYAIRLLWEIDARWMIVRTLTTLGDQLIPIIQLVVAKNIIDRLVAGIGQPIGAVWPRILELILIESGLFLVNALNGRLELLYDQLFREKMIDATNYRIAQQSSSLDPARFEDPEFHTELDRLQRESDWRLQTIYQNLFGMVGSGITLIASAILFAQLPLWILALLTVALIPTFLIQTSHGLARHKVRDDTRNTRRLAGYYFQILTERFIMKDIKINQVEPFFLQRTKRTWDEFEAALASAMRRYLAPDLLASVLAVISRGAVLIWLALSTLARKLTIGQFTLYNSLMQQFAAGLRGLLLSYAAITEHLYFMDNHREFFKTLPVFAEPEKPKRFPKSTEPLIIAFNDVWFRYPGQTGWTLRGVSFEIKSGEHLALVGENGAGKTTIIKLLARFYPPTRGSISINGVNLNDFSRADLYRYLAVMFQDFAQFQATVKENIAFADMAKQQAQPAIIAAAKKSGAHSFVERLNQGYDTLLSREFAGGVDLSGGQWQKLALARSFYRNARFIVLDEPTAALDATAEEHFYRQFLKFEKNVSAILISHRFSTVRMADRIMFLENGKIIESGNHRELMKKNGRYAALFNLQAARYH